MMGKREGYRFWDVDGREFMDFHINGGTYNLGHRNPDLIRLLRESLDELDMGNHHFPSVARARLAEKLSRLSPGGKCKYVVYTSGESRPTTLRSNLHAPPPGVARSSPRNSPITAARS